VTLSDGASEIIGGGHGRTRLSGLPGLGNHWTMDMHALSELPYDYAALEPHVPERTMQRRLPALAEIGNAP